MKKITKTQRSTLKEWKKWTIMHQITPNKFADDICERRLASRMASMLSNWRKNKGVYKELINEYEATYLKYGRRRFPKNKSFDSNFKACKAWIIKNNRLPIDRKDNSKESIIASRLKAIQYRIKKHPSKYEEYKMEVEQLCIDYSYNNTYLRLQKALNEWIAWVYKNNRLPVRYNALEDKDEAKQCLKMDVALRDMRKYPEKCRDLLYMHAVIHVEYGGRKTDFIQKELNYDIKGWE